MAPCYGIGPDNTYQRLGPSVFSVLPLADANPSSPSLRSVIFNRLFTGLYHGPLPFRTGLLCLLKSDQGHLQIVGRLLKMRLVLWL